MNKLFTYTALLVTLCVLVESYDFEDSTFNQILAQTLENIEDSFENDIPLHPRYRRDEEAVIPERCRRRHPKLCCGQELAEEFHEKDKDIRRECFKQFFTKDREPRAQNDPFKCDKAERNKKGFTCALQCIGQKKNVIDDDGNVKEEEFTELVKSRFSKLEWFSPLVDNTITKCVTEAKNATSNRDTSETDSCNPAGLKLLHCLFKEIQLNCPAEEIKDEKACSKLRERIKKNGDIFVPQSHHHDE